MATLSSMLSTLYGNDETGGLWIASPTSCWTDTTGVTPAGDGDLVARIDDQTPNARHATQANDTNKMRLKQEVGGRWYLDPESRDAWYSITSWTGSTPWTVAGSYRVHTDGTNVPVYLYGRSTSSGDWQAYGANFWTGPSRLFLRAGSGNEVLFTSTAANDEAQHLDVICSGVSSDSTTWANALHRLYNPRTLNTFTGSQSNVSGAPTANLDVGVLFRASSTYNRSQIYGVAMRGAATSQTDLDALLVYLSDPDTTPPTPYGFRITDIKEPNVSNELVTGVANATVRVWLPEFDEDAPTWMFANQSITAGALEDITLEGIDPEESSVIVTVHWDAGAGETKFFRYVPSVIDLDA